MFGRFPIAECIGFGPRSSSAEPPSLPLAGHPMLPGIKPIPPPKGWTVPHSLYGVPRHFAGYPRGYNRDGYGTT